MRVILFLLLIIQVVNIKSQDIGEIWIKGSIIDANDKQPIPHVQIASFQRGVLYATNEKGYFSITLNKNDSIRVLSLGYLPEIINFRDLNDSTAQNIEIKLTRTNFQLQEVNIYKKSANEHLSQFMPDDIKLGVVNELHPGLRSDVGGKPRLIAAVTNPLSFFYYHLSSNEKNKRRMILLSNEELKNEKLNKEIIEQISGFEDEELNRFIIYCNTQIILSEKETAETVTRKIIDAYTNFKNQNTNKTSAEIKEITAKD